MNNLFISAKTPLINSIKKNKIIEIWALQEVWLENGKQQRDRWQRMQIEAMIKKKKQDGEGLIILMIKRSKTKSINNGKKFAVIMTGTQISSHLPET